MSKAIPLHFQMLDFLPYANIGEKIVQLTCVFSDKRQYPIMGDEYQDILVMQDGTVFPVDGDTVPLLSFSDKYRMIEAYKQSLAERL